MTESCSVKDCPRRTDADWHGRCQVSIPHRCFGGLSHVHLPRKGMGGNNPKAKIVGICCVAVHDAADNGLRYQGKRWAFGLTDTHWTVTATTKDGDMRAQMIPLEGRTT